MTKTTATKKIVVPQIASPKGSKLAVPGVPSKKPAPAAAPKAAPTPGKHAPYAVTRPCNMPKQAASVLVTLQGAKPYKVAAPHCGVWWAAAQAVLAKAGGKAPMADLVQAGAPGHFLTYAVRRGWLVVA